MKRYLPFIIVVGVALATFGSGAMLYHAKHPQLQAIPEDNAVPANSGSESMHIRGNPNAPVTLEEFGDFQCPPCGSFAGCGSRRAARSFLGDARHAVSRTSGVEQGSQCARIVRIVRGHDRTEC